MLMVSCLEVGKWLSIYRSDCCPGASSLHSHRVTLVYYADSVTSALHVYVAHERTVRRICSRFSLWPYSWPGQLNYVLSALYYRGHLRSGCLMAWIYCVNCFVMFVSYYMSVNNGEESLSSVIIAYSITGAGAISTALALYIFCSRDRPAPRSCARSKLILWASSYYALGSRQHSSEGTSWSWHDNRRCTGRREYQTCSCRTQWNYKHGVVEGRPADLCVICHQSFECLFLISHTTIL